MHNKGSMDNITINLPNEVEQIIYKLESAGFEAYIVGGCVRDSVMRITPHDWGITTSAKPDEVIDLFKNYKVIPTGIQHGTVTVILSKEPYEITTFRVESDYSDSRHPDKVEFVSSLREDLLRRDFTINAMAYNPQKGLIDLFGGLDDIQSKTIFTVGLARFRFHEDALRVFRAIRFSARFDYKISNAILKEIETDEELPDLIRKISKERISAELHKTFACLHHGEQYVSAVVLFAKVLSLVVPEIKDYTDDAWAERFKDSLCGHNLYLNYAMFFDTPNFERIMRELRFDNKTIKHVKNVYQYGYELVENYDGRKRKHRARKLLNKISYMDACNAVLFAKAHRPKYCMNMYNYLYEALTAVYYDGFECYRIDQLKVDGNDAMDCGFSGKECGEVLNTLLELVMTDRLKNLRDDLLEEMRYLKKKGEDE